jgi:carboxyl-terminal processing protease
MRRRVSLGFSALAIWFLSALLSPAVAVGQARLSFVPPPAESFTGESLPGRALSGESAAVESVSGESASGQSSAPQLSAAAEIGSLLERGKSLEGERRWGEALTLYEDALRQFPAARDLESRQQISRMHYELGRRYNDASFRRTLGTMSSRDALDLYTEVLLKIQSHYVDNPNWSQIVEHSSRSFDVALSDPIFVEHHLPRTPQAQIERFRRELPGRVAGYRVTTRHAARDAVAAVARWAHEQLGMTDTAVILEYTCGATTSLDPYSTFLTADQLNEVYSQIEGNFVGLGIELKAADGALLIVKVISHSPAEKSGVVAGDRIVAVGGKWTTELSTDQAANLLQGAEGTVVDVTIESPGRPARVVRVRREHVEVPSVDGVRIADRDEGIGYLRLTCFQKTTSADLDQALRSLHAQGMKSLIIDLRGNPGGLLATSVEVVDKFVERGPIVSTRGRSPQEDYQYGAHEAGTWRMPLVVLIDGDSASASEIFAGAIRDYRRGKIVGTRSYGKGSVQGIFPLARANSGLRLTTAKFYSPNNRAFAGVGVEPDIVVRQAAKPVLDAAGIPLPAAEQPDAVLEAALRAAKDQVAQR